MKRIVLLLGLVIMPYATSGCVLIEYPVDLYLDKKFDVNEVLVIAWTVDTWNSAITARTGMQDPAFRIVGTFTDEYDVEDAMDGYHAIYKVTEPTPSIFGTVEGMSGDSVGGHATMNDMLVLRYNYPELDDDVWPYLLRGIVLHEFGHMLGITHFEHRLGLMNAGMEKEMLNDPHITDADMDAYCHVHGCD